MDRITIASTDLALCAVAHNKIKGFGAKMLCREFSDKGWNAKRVNNLLKKL